MLQTFNSPQSSAFEERGQSLDLGYFIAIARKRIFHFIIPFVVVLIIGFLIVSIQRPIYRAEGRILVESSEIPTNLVEPTVTAAATERIQIIQQRLMARDSLLPIVNKFNLFPSERTWMSGTQILDLMRDRADITLVDLNSLIASKDGKAAPLPPNKNAAIAFTVGFEYENPELAVKVANEFLTSILTEDVRARTGHASETTEFLAQEVKRLQAKLDAINAQIFEAKRSTDPKQTSQEIPTQSKLQITQLADLKAQLVAQSSVHSEEWPAVKSLKKRIAALESEIARTPKENSAPSPPPDKDVDALEQQQKSNEKDLDDASKKLTAARLGESMERNQQSEHLQVIEQPIVPQKPIKPNKLKLFAASFGLATILGIGAVVLAEMLDKTIRSSRELIGVVDSHLVVTIPYIATVGELARRKRKVILLWAAIVVFLLAGLALALYIGIAVDFSWFDQSTFKYYITRLSK